MLKSSSVKVYYILKNYKNTKKNVNKDFSKYTHILYKNSSKYMKILCKKIYNDIENSKYTYNDLIIYLIHNAMFSRKENFNEINKENIKKISDLYKKQRLIIDKENIKKIMKELNIKFNYLFNIDERGGTLCFDFCNEEIISPLLWILKSKKYFVEESFFVKLFENDNHKTFRKYCNVIKKYLKEV